MYRRVEARTGYVSPVWAFLCPRRQHPPTVDATVAYAVERDWLIAARNPAHSICSLMRGMCGRLGA